MATPQRIRDLVARRTQPANRSEQEIAGYREVLNSVHTNFADMPLTSNLVLQLHRDLFQFVPGGGGRWKATDNDITETRADGTTVVRFTPTAAHLTPDAMTRLHDEYRATLSLLLLYQAGYEVGLYISLEGVIEQTKDGYYDSLSASSQQWHEGQHSLVSWWEYFVGVMLVKACRRADSDMRISSARCLRSAGPRLRVHCGSFGWRGQSAASGQGATQRGRSYMRLDSRTPRR